MECDSEELPDCIEKGCPYKGYQDTMKCWFHSLGIKLPELYQTPTISTGLQTFKEALGGHTIEECIELVQKGVM